MSLSVSTIYDIFNKYVTHDKIDYYFINYILENFPNISMPAVMKGVCGIDCEICYIILLESEKKSNIIPRGFTKENIELIYFEIYQEFAKYCFLNGYKKTPSVFTFEKDLKLKNLFKVVK